MSHVSIRHAEPDDYEAMHRIIAPVRLEGVNDRGVVVLVTRHHEQGDPRRYFYPWGVVGWMRLADEDERAR